MTLTRTQCDRVTPGTLGTGICQFGGLVCGRLGQGQGWGSGRLPYCWAGSRQGANEVPWGQSPCPFLIGPGPPALGEAFPHWEVNGVAVCALGSRPQKAPGSSQCDTCLPPEPRCWLGWEVPAQLFPQNHQIPDPNEFLEGRHSDLILVIGVSGEQVPGLCPPRVRPCRDTLSVPGTWSPPWSTGLGARVQPGPGKVLGGGSGVCFRQRVTRRG